MKTIKTTKSIKRRNTETDIYFSDPNVLSSIKKGIKDVKAGKVTLVRDLKNIWADIL